MTDPLQPIDVTAPSLEQAIEDGLTQLGLTRDDVIIEIIEEGSRGVLGMGARPAVVRLTPLKSPIPHQASPPPRPRQTTTKQAPVEEAPPTAPEAEVDAEPTPVRALAPQPSPESMDDDARVATEALTELLSYMGIQAEVQAHRAEEGTPDEDAPWVLDVHGEDLGILIGRRGETLNALQYITRLIVSRELQRRANIVIDVEGYKARRETALRKLALRMAKQVKQVGRPITLEPMPPNERRIIHITLREDKGVDTESVGVGDQRKVTISPVGER
nr:Jag N-terminal domain-containing protein [Anaerolineae bacterium]